MPEIVADPPSPAAICCFPDPQAESFNDLRLIAPSDARERFAKGSSSNLHGRPPGIRNPS
jgi:hypothetical protein